MIKLFETTKVKSPLYKGESLVLNGYCYPSLMCMDNRTEIFLTTEELEKFQAEAKMKIWTRAVIGRETCEALIAFLQIKS